MAVDGSGNLYVADAGSGTVQQFVGQVYYNTTWTYCPPGEGCATATNGYSIPDYWTTILTNVVGRARPWIPWAMSTSPIKPPTRYLRSVWRRQWVFAGLHRSQWS